LQFVGESLDEVAATINRYGATRIVVAGPLERIQFTGTVLPSNIHEWLRAVEEIYAAKVVDQGTAGILIRPRIDHATRN
jgi:ferric-dicitrate binding protein FerR (iron transport regulator)